MENLREVAGPDLTADQLHRLLRLRVDVFVVEQQCPYEEVDGRDLLTTTTHVWLEDGGQVTSALRLLDADGPEGPLAVGRVVTAPAHRGTGLAGRLLQGVVTAHGHRRLELEAQAHLADWYRRFGFERSGDDLVLDGIPHTPMVRPVGQVGMMGRDTSPSSEETAMAELSDHGPKPYTVNIEETTLANENFRSTLWTGEYLQMTVMSIPVGGEVGLEMHADHDQFLRIEQGTARVQMGPAEDDLSYDETVGDDWVALVPAGQWHNITNTGDEPLKLYSLYGPPDHVKGTLHATKEDAENDPNEQH